MALQVRRGTNAERLGITPLAGELIYVTDTKQLYVGDGTTAGGTTTIANTIDSVLADTSPQLGGELDLNGNNITGTGNINITGTITATGNINLGDDVGDIISLTGAIAGHLVPQNDSDANSGSPTKFWNSAWINQLTVDSQITAERIQADIIADDSTVVFSASTGLIAAEQVSGTFTGNVTGNVTGDVTGSVFSDSSTLLVDGVAGNIPASVINGTLTNDLTGTVTGNLTGNVTGNANGNHTGTFTGEVLGSIYSDDSTQIIDGLTGNVTTSIANVTTLNNNSIQDRDDSGILTVNLNNAGGNSQPRIVLESNGSAGSGLWITTNDTTRTLAGTDNIGRILFRSIDAGGTETPVVAIARKDEFIISVGSKNTAETFHMATATGNYGLGIEPNASAKVNVGGAVLLGNLTTTERNALTAANGMIIYNTTDNKFQGYENGAWANLI